MSEHAEFELLDAYLLGTLDAPQAAAVRAHLAGCAGCRAEYEELREVLDVLPHALPEEPVSAASRARLMARAGAAPLAAAAGSRPRIAPMAALAAALALALAGDIWLASELHRPAATVAIVAPSPTPRPTAIPATSTPAVTLAAHISAPASAVPSPIPRLSEPSAGEAALRARIASLEHELTLERQGARSQASRLVALEAALAHDDAQLAELRRAAPLPSSAPSPGLAAPDLVAALSSGRVYGVDGTIGAEPWHLTIVQPPAGANALIFSQVPHAPSGDTYRTWVVRGDKTYDAGELPAGTQTKLEMPMPLADGDVVAFSREPLNTGSLPTTPFLMEVKITR